MTVLILSRHGRTDWNDEGRYQGHSDPPLNAEGGRQAAELAERLGRERLAAVYSSDLRRAADTARAIAACHGLPVRVDPRLREINQGRWDGRLYSEILAMDEAILRAWEAHPLSTRPPGGESLAEVSERVVAAAAEILARHAGQTVCIVCHKVSMTVLRCAITGDDLERSLALLPPNGSFVRLELPDAPPWFAGESPR